jgi:hypothetical protein
LKHCLWKQSEEKGTKTLNLRPAPFSRWIQVPKCAARCYAVAVNFSAHQLWVWLLLGAGWIMHQLAGDVVWSACKELARYVAGKLLHRILAVQLSFLIVPSLFEMERKLRKFVTVFTYVSVAALTVYFFAKCRPALLPTSQRV